MVKMRKISKNIHETFEIKAIEGVKEKIPEICKKHDVKIKNNELPFRPIIQAGDDITFVCNERIALDIVKEYISIIRKGYMYSEKYTFSACAGISIIHSHFPFFKGYQIAEECCEIAKKSVFSLYSKEDLKCILTYFLYILTSLYNRSF